MKRIAALGFCFLFFLCLGGSAVADVGGMPDPTYTPGTPEYYNVEGGNAYSRGEFEEALALYQKALTLDPGYWHAYHGLAFTYRAMGRLDLALENYAVVMELEPGYAQPHASSARIYQFMGRDAEAAAALDRYVALDGQYPVPYVVRGDFLLESGAYLRAIDDYTTAFEKGLAASVQHEVYLKRAMAWLKLGELDQAAADVEAALGPARLAGASGHPQQGTSSYDEAEAAPGAVPYAFDGFETYVVIIGAYELNAKGRDEEETEEQLETIRRLQDMYFTLSDFYLAYAPQSVEHGNEMISIINQVVPMLDRYKVSRFDSSEVSEFDLYEIIFDAWYYFDPEGAASEDMETTVEMVEFVLYQ